jgi:pimeloyl-ACP methyl ester carboxylesterase
MPSARFLDGLGATLEAFVPVELREQVTSSWEREATVQTQEECAELLHDQWRFHFKDPLDPRIEEAEARMQGAIHAPDVLRHFAVASYGGIEVEDRLADVTHPVLVLGGRYDRACPAEASERTAELLPNVELHIFEDSAHMTYVEQQDEYLAVVGRFLGRVR